jgi:hypothetical protein
VGTQYLLRNRTTIATTWNASVHTSITTKFMSMASTVRPPTARQHMARMRVTAQNMERRSSSSSSWSLRAQYFRSPPRMINAKELVNSSSRDAAPVMTMVYPRTSSISRENSYQVVQRSWSPFQDSQMSMMPMTVADRKNADTTTLSTDSS